MIGWFLSGRATDWVFSRGTKKLMYEWIVDEDDMTWKIKDMNRMIFHMRCDGEYWSLVFFSSTFLSVMNYFWDSWALLVCTKRILSLVVFVGGQSVMEFCIQYGLSFQNGTIAFWLVVRSFVWYFYGDFLYVCRGKDVYKRRSQRRTWNYENIPNISTMVVLGVQPRVSLR